MLGWVKGDQPNSSHWLLSCIRWVCLQKDLCVCRVIYLYVCCSCGGTPSALDSPAADCETSDDASVGPRGFGKQASVAPPWLPLRTLAERRPIWSAPSRQGPRSWGRWAALRGTAAAAGRPGLAGPPWRWSAAGAGCCRPSDRRCPGRGAASEPASRGSAVCRGAPPFCVLSVTLVEGHFMD